MNDKLFQGEKPVPDSVLCGNSLIGPNQGECAGCHKPSPTLAQGFCTPCALKRGVNPLAPPISQPKCNESSCECDY